MQHALRCGFVISRNPSEEAGLGLLGLFEIDREVVFDQVQHFYTLLHLFVIVKSRSVAGESERMRVILGRLIHSQACLLLLWRHFDRRETGLAHGRVLERRRLPKHLGTVLVVH